MANSRAAVTSARCIVNSLITNDHEQGPGGGTMHPRASGGEAYDEGASPSTPAHQSAQIKHRATRHPKPDGAGPGVKFLPLRGWLMYIRESLRANHHRSLLTLLILSLVVPLVATAQAGYNAPVGSIPDINMGGGYMPGQAQMDYAQMQLEKMNRDSQRRQ